SAPVLAVKELDAVRHDLGHLPPRALLSLVAADLQPALDGDQTTLGEVLRGKFRRLPPRDDVDEVGLPLTLAVLERPVNCEREVGHRLAAGHVPELGVPSQPANKKDPVHSFTPAIQRLFSAI